ncbi:MAG: hypothetical protein ACO27U_09505 [Ilumatobacteraceae bacterium]|jgi:hypothetical protein
MKTRTLLLLSVACGLIILLAGGFKLLQVASDRTEVPVLSIGGETRIGDMTVRVESITTTEIGTETRVAMAGVPGELAVDGWRLLGDGEVAEPFTTVGESTAGDAVCDARTTVPESGEVVCVVRFPSVETVQAVAYTRAGEQRQWAP